MQDSHPKIYGVLGYPAKHSLSPLMHNAAFRALGINAEYRIFEIKPEELDAFLKSVAASNIYGLNVTIPYKEEVLKYLRWQAPEVRFTGAANTIIVKDKDYLEGWNTDGIGFHRHLVTDLKFDPCDKKIVILGAGGAAKAVTDQLARGQAKIIVIYDIDTDKSSKLAKKINREFPRCTAISADNLDSLELRSADLLINATPLGMKDADPCLINEDSLHRDLLVYDLIYNPKETKLLKLARQKGARVSNGLGMLLYQGMRSFELWTDRQAPKEAMEKALSQDL